LDLLSAERITYQSYSIGNAEARSVRAALFVAVRRIRVPGTVEIPKLGNFGTLDTPQHAE
jgi:hypothetical protein